MEVRGIEPLTLGASEQRSHTLNKEVRFVIRSTYAKAEKDQRRTLSRIVETARLKRSRGDRNGAKTKTLDTETKANLDQEFKSQIEKYHAEPHYWVTFHKMGDDDNIETVYIGAAGVGYTCRKGERVLLPQSALNCMKYAVREGLDHGRPVEVNGRKYLKKGSPADAQLHR